MRQGQYNDDTLRDDDGMTLNTLVILFPDGRRLYSFPAFDTYELGDVFEHAGRSYEIRNVTRDFSSNGTALTLASREGPEREEVNGAQSLRKRLMQSPNKLRFDGREREFPQLAHHPG